MEAEADGNAVPHADSARLRDAFKVAIESIKQQINGAIQDQKFDMLSSLSKQHDELNELERRLTELRDGDEDFKRYHEQAKATLEKLGFSIQQTPTDERAPASAPPQAPKAKHPIDDRRPYQALYNTGDRVQYNSPSFKDWIPTTVLDVNNDGQVLLACKKEKWMSVSAQATRLRKCTGEVATPNRRSSSGKQLEKAPVVDARRPVFSLNVLEMKRGKARLEAFQHPEFEWSFERTSDKSSSSSRSGPPKALPSAGDRPSSAAKRRAQKPSVAKAPKATAAEAPRKRAAPAEPETPLARSRGREPDKGQTVLQRRSNKKGRASNTVTRATQQDGDKDAADVTDLFSQDESEEAKPRGRRSKRSQPTAEEEPRKHSATAAAAREPPAKKQAKAKTQAKPKQTSRAPSPPAVAEPAAPEPAAKATAKAGAKAAAKAAAVKVPEEQALDRKAKQELQNRLDLLEDDYLDTVLRFLEPYLGGNSEDEINLDLELLPPHAQHLLVKVVDQELDKQRNRQDAHARGERTPPDSPPFDIGKDILTPLQTATATPLEPPVSPFRLEELPTAAQPQGQSSSKSVIMPTPTPYPTPSPAPGEQPDSAGVAAGKQPVADGPSKMLLESGAESSPFVAPPTLQTAGANVGETAAQQPAAASGASPARSASGASPARRGVGKHWCQDSINQACKKVVKHTPELTESKTTPRQGPAAPTPTGSPKEERAPDSMLDRLDLQDVLALAEDRPDGREAADANATERSRVVEKEVAASAAGGISGISGESI